MQNQWNQRKVIKKGDIDVLQGEDPKRVAGALSIFTKLAQQYDENTFVEAMKTGDLPPLKLTAHEMEIARGGIRDKKLIDLIFTKTIFIPQV